MRYVLVSHRKVGHDTVLKLRAIPGWFGRLFRAKPKEVEFVGDCTVWHQLPEFKRPGTSMEGMLANIHAKIKHEECMKAVDQVFIDADKQFKTSCDAVIQRFHDGTI